MIFVEMPRANENLTEATLDRWLVGEGAAISVGQSLCDIITDKAKFELPSPAAGTLRKIYALERSMLPVNFVLCAIGDAAEALPADVETKNEALLAAHKGLVTSTPSLMQEVSASSGATAIRATPAARRVAKELGIELGDIVKALTLTAPISEKDVREFAAKR